MQKSEKGNKNNFNQEPKIQRNKDSIDRAPEMAEGWGTRNRPPETEGQATATNNFQRRGDRSKKVTPVLEEEDLANQPLPVKHGEKQFIPGQIVYETEEAALQMITYDQLPKEPGTGVIIIPDLSPDRSGRYVAAEHYSQIPLGKGACGETCLCKDNSSDKIFVEKRIEYNKFNWNEVKILLRARHENIIKFYGVIIDKKDNGEIVVRILMEYGGTSLKKYVAEKKTSEIDQLNLSVQLSTVLAFLHDRGIIHKDVHPWNVVIRTDGDREHLKLIDFGLSVCDTLDMMDMMKEEASSFGEIVLFFYTGQFMVDNPKFELVPPDIVHIIKTLTNRYPGKLMSVEEAKKLLEEKLKKQDVPAEPLDEDLPDPANLADLCEMPSQPSHEPRAMSSQQKIDGDSRQ